MSESQIAVLIDYENVGLGSIQGLFDQLSDMGRIIVKRAYADWSSGARQRDQLLELGIEAVHHFHAAKVAKNSSDISLCIDAVDLLYRSPVDTFVIVSADSDFVTLVSKLRSAGKTVIGAGRHDVVSSTLVRACDRYIYLGTGPKTAPAESQSIDALVQRAIYASADDEGKVAGSRLHQTMMRIDPSFDFRSMGFRTFTQFLEASPVVKVSRSRGSDDISITLKPTGMARLPGIGRVLGGRSRGQQAAAIEAPPVEPALEALPAPVRAPVTRRSRPVRPAAPAPVRPAPAPLAAPVAVMAAPEPPPLPAAVMAAPEPPPLPVAVMAAPEPPPLPAAVMAAPEPPPLLAAPLPAVVRAAPATPAAPAAMMAAPEPPSLPAPLSNTWESDIHSRWSQRVDKGTGVLNGTRAAGEAARILEAPKLSSSRYKTLQKLLASSSYLAARWEREGNSLRVKAPVTAGIFDD